MGNKYAFTGTRKGMTPLQMRTLMTELLRIKLAGGRPEFHHGGAEGADHEAHVIALSVGFLMRVHPSNNNVAPETAYYWDTARVEEMCPPLVRNHDIVDFSHILFATPAEQEEQVRSGTWATIRYGSGRIKKKPHSGPYAVRIIYPNGEIEEIRP